MLNRPTSSMGPPPPKESSPQKAPKDPNLEVAEKYSRLKKKYFELKEVSATPLFLLHHYSYFLEIRRP